jgi:hypothetical protein
MVTFGMDVCGRVDRKNENKAPQEMSLLALIMQLARTTRKRRNHSENRVVGVALGNSHVQVVKTLAQDIHDPGRDFAEVVVLTVLVIGVDRVGGQ